MVIPISNQCPADAEDIAEAYVMSKLGAAETASYEEHYVGCDRCAKALQAAAEYVEAMHAAAKSMTLANGSVG